MTDRQQAQNTTRPKKPKAAPVRHTLTSMRRLLKANPLLKYELNGEPLPGMDENTLLKNSVKDKVLNVVKKPLARSHSTREVPKKTTIVKQQVAKEKPTASKEQHPAKQQKIAGAEQVQFKTPIAYKRRSTIFATPNTCIAKSRPSFASTPGPSAYDLQKRLNDWLKKHGKPVKTFDNLKSFGIKHDRITKNEENKENIETKIEKDDSYEELGITQEEVPVKEECKSKEEVQQDLVVIAKDALKDLRKLILEGYPREQCEAWLGAIREKYKNLEEDPLYWECLAALEETVGHISAAVEYYRTAIVQGAEVKEVDESLEQMLQKFSLLNINSVEKQENEGLEKPKYDRNKVVLAARNVFKSSIIQFAIEERKHKKGRNAVVIPEEKKKLVVTPVRRSTRRRTGYVITPDVTMCSTLEKLRETAADDAEFRHNNNLAARFFN